MFFGSIEFFQILVLRDGLSESIQQQVIYRATTFYNLVALFVNNHFAKMKGSQRTLVRRGAEICIVAFCDRHEVILVFHDDHALFLIHF